jgi:hypothetical protein
MRESPIVEEGKHLIPNLPILVKALFGDNAYLTSKVPHQADWATGKSKIGDGLLWLPWLRQLWLIEVEWREASNFFDQSRAFAEGEVNKERLYLQLKEILEQFGEVLTRYSSELSEGLITKKIIEQTLENHISRGYLRPHGWVILGHKGNREKLRRDYQKELEDRFRGDKHFILSMARMFVGDFSSYFLLEQYWSKGGEELLKIEDSILVPAKYTAEKAQEVVVGVEEKEEEEKVKPVLAQGRAAHFFSILREKKPSLSPKDVRLRIQIDEHRYHDFRPIWTHEGLEFMVFSTLGIMTRKPFAAAKEVFPDLTVEQYRDVARRVGTFYDFSETPPRKIADWKDVDEQFRKLGVRPSLIKREDAWAKRGRHYFDYIDAGKAKVIESTILNRKELWWSFLEKREMTLFEFKELSHFKGRELSAFTRFLTTQRIASRHGDIFKLSEEVVPLIRELLEIGANY